MSFTSFKPNKSKLFRFQKTYLTSFHPIFIVVRLVIFFGLIYYLQLNIESEQLNKAMGLLGLYLFIESYLFVGLDRSRALPKTAGDENINLADYLSKEVVALYAVNNQSEKIFTSLTRRAEVNFLIERLDLKVENQHYADLDLNEVLHRSYEIRTKLGHSQIFPTTLFAAYLSATEPKTKTLFNAYLKEEDLIDALNWAQMNFYGSWYTHMTPLAYGSGLAAYFNNTWGLDLDKYSKDFTLEALDGNDLLIGQEESINHIENVLSENQSANVIITGPPGIGKETIVKSIALRTFYGHSKPVLNYKRVIRFNLGSFLAGINNEGDIHDRFINLVNDILAGGNIILYIPDINNLFESDYNQSLIDAILPYLQSQKVRLIATVTDQDYRKLINKHELFLNQFSQVNLVEPDHDNSLKILELAATRLEKRFKSRISFLALKEIINLKNKYYLDKVMPGKAIALLDYTLSKFNHNQSLITQEMLRSVITELSQIPVGLPQESELADLNQLEAILHQRIVGQDQAVSALANAIRVSRAQLENKSSPIGVFLFLGPTGVGKTETAKALAAYYYKSESRMIRLDMNQFQTEESIDKIIGGDNQLSQLTDQVIKNPYSLILLDEFEKANQKVQNLFLQAFDEGQIIDGQGRRVVLSNCIIIATSNAESEFIRQSISQNQPMAVIRPKLMENLQAKNIFKPELLNRFNEIVVFKPLTQAEIAKVAENELLTLKSELTKQDIRFEITPVALEKLAVEGYSVEYGARPLKRYIHDYIEVPISNLILNKKLIRGQKVITNTDASGNFCFDTN